jgi:hypothetical protein
LNLSSSTLNVLGLPVELSLETDSNFSTPRSEGWMDTNFIAVLNSGSGSWSLPTAQPIPEPSTFTLLAAGVLSVAGYGWRRARAGVPAP